MQRRGVSQIDAPASRICGKRLYICSPPTCRRLGERNTHAKLDKTARRCRVKSHCAFKKTFAVAVMFRSLIFPISLLLMADYGLAYAESGLPYASLDQPAVVLGDTDIIQMSDDRELQAPPKADSKPVRHRQRAPKQDISGEYLQDLRSLAALPDARFASRNNGGLCFWTTVLPTRTAMESTRL